MVGYELVDFLGADKSKDSSKDEPSKAQSPDNIPKEEPVDKFKELKESLIT